MLGSIQSESGFDVGEGRISDVYPERGERIREVGGTVVAADGVSELTSGVFQRGKTGLVERVYPRSDEQRRTKVREANVCYIRNIAYIGFFLSSLHWVAWTLLTLEGSPGWPSLSVAPLNYHRGHLLGVPMRRIRCGSRTTGCFRGNVRSDITRRRRAYAELVRHTIDAKKRLKLLSSSIGCCGESLQVDVHPTRARQSRSSLYPSSLASPLSGFPPLFRSIQFLQCAVWRFSSAKDPSFHSPNPTSNDGLSCDGTNTSGVSPGRPAIRVTGGRDEQSESILFCRGSELDTFSILPIRSSQRRFAGSSMSFYPRFNSPRRSFFKVARNAHYSGLKRAGEECLW